MKIESHNEKNRKRYLPLPGLITVASSDTNLSTVSKNENLTDGFRKWDDVLVSHISGIDVDGISNHNETYVALFGYKARSNSDISFRKGDLMELLDDKIKGDWRKARISDRVGLVPSSYIAKHGSLESKE